tara:strand:- start:377 stop:1222 length:846 start_codon:yes stop_codon:yes gene_type:complete
MKIFSAILLSAAIVLASTTAFANSKKSGVVPEQEHLQMLYPTVLVRLANGSGSGTVIYSSQNEELEYESYVLTNWHVVQSYVKLTKVWSPERKEHVETENRRPVNIDLWEYNNFSVAVGTIGRLANIVAYDKSRDLALLQVADTERKMPHVASIYPEDKDDGPWIFQTVYAVGAGLGKPPFPTMGLLSGYGKDTDGNDLYLASAPIIFGNSGGALYVYSPRREYELIGVPSMVSAYGWGNVVTHMAWSRPIAEIRIFLRDAGYGVKILGDEPEEEEVETND